MSQFLDDTTNLLRRTPQVVRALLYGLPDAWAATPDTDGGWRPRDVVGHLITAEQDNWIARIERLLEHGTSQPFEAFNRTAHVGRDDELTLDQLVERFETLRTADLARLAELVTDADLDRRGMHPALGEVTLRQVLASWTVHDLDHIAQIFAGLAGSRDIDVGAWKAYLGILLRREDPAAVPG